jgi:hypothetical protein
MTTDATRTAAIDLTFRIIETRMDPNGDYWQHLREVFADQGTTAVHVFNALVNATVFAVGAVEAATTMPASEFLARTKQRVEAQTRGDM